MNESIEPFADFDEIDAILFDLGTDVRAAEFHGFTCGMLSGGMRLTEEEWLNHLLDHLDAENQPSPDDQEILLAMYRHSLEQLRDRAVEFVFHPLLPEGDYPIDERVRAVGHWCQGFLGGLGMVNTFNPTEDEAIVNEALKDLVAISQVDAAGTDQTEQAEQDLMEIIEFVRMACLTIFTEYGLERASRQQEQAKSSLH